VYRQFANALKPILELAAVAPEGVRLFGRWDADVEVKDM
jgi:hypothetical protein